MDKIFNIKGVFKTPFIVLLENFGAGTQTIIAVVGIIPVHLELTIVPVRVGHIAIGIARAPLLLSNFINITDNS